MAEQELLMVMMGELVSPCFVLSTKTRKEGRRRKG